MKEYKLGTSVLVVYENYEPMQLQIKVRDPIRGYVELVSIDKKDYGNFKHYLFHVKIVVALLNHYRDKWQYREKV